MEYKFSNLPHRIFAQQTQLLLSGKVLSRGTALAEVKVTATNRKTGKAYTAFTDSGGKYGFLEITAGTYDVKVEKDQYMSIIRKRIAIRSGHEKQTAEPAEKALRTPREHLLNTYSESRTLFALSLWALRFGFIHTEARGTFHKREIRSPHER